MKRFSKTLILLLICLVFCGLKAGVSAENSSETAKLSRMTFEEKLKLWNSFSEEKKEAIRKRAKQMSEQKFRQLKDNFQKIEKLEPEEKQRVENNFKRLRGLEPVRQKQIIEKFRRFEKLPVEKKHFYREKSGVRGGRRADDSHSDENRPGRISDNNGREKLADKDDSRPNRHEERRGEKARVRESDENKDGIGRKVPRNEKQKEERHKARKQGRPDGLRKPARGELRENENANRKDREDPERIKRRENREEREGQEKIERREERRRKEVGEYRERMMRNSENNTGKADEESWEKVREFRKTFSPENSAGKRNRERPFEKDRPDKNNNRRMKVN